MLQPQASKSCGSKSLHTHYNYQVFLIQKLSSIIVFLFRITTLQVKDNYQKFEWFWSDYCSILIQSYSHATNPVPSKFSIPVRIKNTCIASFGFLVVIMDWSSLWSPILYLKKNCIYSENIFILGILFNYIFSFIHSTFQYRDQNKFETSVTEFLIQYKGSLIKMIQNITFTRLHKE